MADDLREVIEPELAVALERMAERYRTTQDFLPLWLKELLEEYGEACAARAVRWVHERDTARPHQKTSWDDEVTPTRDPWEDL